MLQIECNLFLLVANDLALIRVAFRSYAYQYLYNLMDFKSHLAPIILLKPAINFISVLKKVITHSMLNV